MTLEPVHMQAIAQIVRRIDLSVEENDETPENVDLFDMLSELTSGGSVVLKAIGKPFRNSVSKRTLALSSDPGGASPVYACDSGSTNTIPFECGFFADICHCVAVSVPTDAAFQRRRTLVCVGYSASSRSVLPTDADVGNIDTWPEFDDGSGKSLTVSLDASALKNRISGTVHDVAVYLSESSHILRMQPQMDPSGLLIMDGPIYPKQLLYSLMGPSGLPESAFLKYDPAVRAILQNYVSVADFHMTSGMPVAGFVKNPADTRIVRTLKERLRSEKIFIDTPWTTDSQLFKALLRDIPEGCGIRPQDRIDYTNWFVQPDQLYENIFAKGTLSDVPLHHAFDAQDYALSFFIVLVRIDGRSVLFRIESPYGLVKNEDMRRRITQKILFELSLHPIPQALARADSLAKVSVSEKRTIRDMFKGAGIDTTYNEIRWGDLDEF